MTSLLDKIVSYGPKTTVLTKDQAARSVVVQNIPPDTAADGIVIHFQRQKNGGGEIDHVHIPEKGTAVITFESSEVAERVLKHSQKFEGLGLELERFIAEEIPEVFQQVEARLNFDKFHIPPRESQNLLEILRENTGVACRKRSKIFILSGKLSQIEAANKLLCHLINLKGGNEAIGGNTAQTHQDSSRGSDELASEPSSIAESSSFEVQPQFMKLLREVYKRDLQDIERKFAVKIDWDENAHQVSISHRKMSKGQKRFQEGCDEFIDLYQKFHPNIRREVVEFPKEANDSRVQEAISFVETNNLVIVEKVENSLVVYAEKDGISSSVRALKQKLGLREDSSNRKTRRGQGNDSRDARDYCEGQQSAFALPQHLNQVLKNDVVLSLYQGDITDERVDAIVNAANESLQHGAGVAGAIVRKGGRQIQDESNRLTQKYGQLNVGEATYTSGGFLPCRYVIHTVGPRWREHGRDKSIFLLRKACVGSLRVAAQLELSSIALTAISSGIFGMPKEICAQVMFKAVEEFSAGNDAEFSNLRDVRIVIIDYPTISVFHEEFVKRYLSQEASPGTVTNQEHPSHEERETSPVTNLKEDPQKFGRDNSVDSVGRTQTEGNKSSDGKSEQNGELESPSEHTAQDEEKNDKHVVSDSIKEGPLSNQSTENTNRANIPSSVKAAEIEQGGVDSQPKDNSAPVKNSHKDNKRTLSSGRGRGNLALRFPGKDRSTPNESVHLPGQNVAAVRGRGFTSKPVRTTSSPPGLTVTEEGKHLVHLCNHVQEEQKTSGGASVEYKDKTEIGNPKTTSLLEGRQSQESEIQKQNNDKVNPIDESEERSPKEQKSASQPNVYQENASENASPSGKNIVVVGKVIEKSPKGYEAEEDMKLSTAEKAEIVTPIDGNGKDVSDPDCDAADDGGTTSQDPVISQTTGKEMEAVIEGSANGESLLRGPKHISDLQASPQAVNEIVEDAVGESKDAQGSPREESGTGPLTLERCSTGEASEPKCLMCMNLSRHPVHPSKCARGHYYCKTCITHLLEKTNICPQCEKEGPLKRAQPVGFMTWTTEKQRSLPGYQDYGIIVVHFTLGKGTQGPEHPNPGQPHSGLEFCAFLPCNKDGKEVCDLLKMAFDERMLFTIGTSPATREENVIVCDGIELKTSESGGPANYGYPDPSYLDRVKSQLAEKGIRQLHPSVMSTGDCSNV